MQRQSNPNSLTAELAPEDGKALDALIGSRASGPRLTERDDVRDVDPQRIERVEAVLELVGMCPAVDAPDDLVRRTLGRITRHEATDPDVARLHAQGRGVDAPIRMREILAVAAMLLVAASLILPVLAKTRSEAMRIACNARIGTVGKAFAHYASDHLGQMPRREAAPNAEWFHVGWTRFDWEPVRSNTVNLYLLARDRYVEPSTLACPANQHAPRVMTADVHDWPSARAVSYSYQNQFGPKPRLLRDNPRMAILADKNPRFRTDNGMTLEYDKSLRMSACSRTHGGWGQNVLFADGSVLWYISPRMSNGDHIWLAEGIDDYSGNETSSHKGDAFLIP